MVALAAGARLGVVRWGGAWLAAAVAVIVIGALPRVIEGGAGDRSAAVLAVVLECAVAAVAWVVLRSARATFIAAAVAVGALSLTMLAPRAESPYDDRRALYRTDETLSVPVSGSGSVLPLWMEPRFTGAAPRFALAAEVDGTAITYSCPWQRGIQHVGLPMPTRDAHEVRLRLTGTPGRDGDYLIVYSSAQQATIPLADLIEGMVCTASGD